MQCCRGLVSGRVQGVGFRYFVRQTALVEGVTGHARNLPNGQVEVLLCGEVDSVAHVQEQVARGPAEAEVSGVEWEPCKTVELNGFTVS